jgi:hypothetical protein
MERRDQLVGGAVLVAIGAAILVGQYVESAEQFILLALGIVLLVLFALTRNPGALIGGGIVTGLGAGVLIAANTQGDIAGAAVLFGLGLGFVGVWLVGTLLKMPETRVWPLIPGAILVAVGFVVLADSENVELPDWLWPALLMGLGVVVILAALRGRGRGPEGGSPGGTSSGGTGG